MKVDLGCGSLKKQGFIGVDCINLPGVDIIHNLNQYPYPFKDSEIEEVWMNNTLEHLEDPLRVMEEIYRITKNGAEITVSVPYFRSYYAFIDPTHKNYFGLNWFNYFDPGHPYSAKYQYTKAKFKVTKIEFDREAKGQRIGIVRWLMIRFAEKKPLFYEQKLSHLYPLNSLTFYLETVK